MPTNLEIDDALLNKALKIGGLSSKKATVNEALKEFIARRKRTEAVAAFGTIEFADEADYKADRTKR
ncbi:MAG: hypothetical protein JWO36_3922 [Myxococcales bacterium]|nr:hypothetical protein [Myxococcales bacterium]